MDITKSTQSRRSQSYAVSALKDKSRSSLDSDANWLITLSDMLSLLLIFFVMFVAMSKAADKQVSAEPVETATPAAPERPLPVPSDREEIRGNILDEMNSEITRLDLEQEVSVREVGREIVISLKEKVTFRPGEAETLASSEPILDNIARIIKRHPELHVEIEGHTDSLPIRTRLYPSNWELSVARSTSVLKYFISRHGIDPSRLSIKGSADQKPLAANDTPENRAHNRRVEIRMKSGDA